MPQEATGPVSYGTGLRWGFPNSISRTGPWLQRHQSHDLGSEPGTVVDPDPIPQAIVETIRVVRVAARVDSVRHGQSLAVCFIAIAPVVWCFLLDPKGPIVY
jgi:hypothetical protein